MIRVLSSFMMAALVSVLFLIALKASIEINLGGVSDIDNLKVIDFVRLKREERLTRKERVKPKKPKPKKPLIAPKVKINKPKPPEPMNRPPVKALALNLPVDLSATSALGDALVGGFGDRAVNANVVPLARINPVYPKRARMMKKEGYVKLEFTITEVGSVKDIEVVESQPPSLFDRSATRALLKWKFKPKMEENQMVAQRASVQIDFKLDK